MFTRAKIFELVIRTLMDIQEMSGRAVLEITGESRPLDDLEGFDSLNATEACYLLSDLLGCEIEFEIFERRHGENASVRQIVDRLCSILEIEGEQYA